MAMPTGTAGYLVEISASQRIYIEHCKLSKVTNGTGFRQNLDGILSGTLNLGTHEVRIETKFASHCEQCAICIEASSSLIKVIKSTD